MIVWQTTYDIYWKITQIIFPSEIFFCYILFLCIHICVYGKTISFRQMVYQRGNQRDGSPHYVFLYSDDENSGDEENIPLQQRNKPTSLPRKVEVINVPLKSEDTLQALALRYRCTVKTQKKIKIKNKLQWTQMGSSIFRSLNWRESTRFTKRMKYMQDAS